MNTTTTPTTSSRPGEGLLARYLGIHQASVDGGNRHLISLHFHQHASRLAAQVDELRAAAQLVLTEGEKVKPIPPEDEDPQTGIIGYLDAQGGDSPFNCWPDGGEDRVMHHLISYVWASCKRYEIDLHIGDPRTSGGHTLTFSPPTPDEAEVMAEFFMDLASQILIRGTRQLCELGMALPEDEPAS